MEANLANVSFLWKLGFFSELVFAFDCIFDCIFIYLSKSNPFLSPIDYPCDIQHSYGVLEYNVTYFRLSVMHNWSQMFEKNVFPVKMRQRWLKNLLSERISHSIFLKYLENMWSKFKTKLKKFYSHDALEENRKVSMKLKCLQYLFITTFLCTDLYGALKLSGWSYVLF